MLLMGSCFLKIPMSIIRAKIGKDDDYSGKPNYQKVKRLSNFKGVPFMYLSFGKNVSNENPIWRIWINYGKISTFQCACPPVTLLLLISLTHMSLFAAFEMKDWWLDSGYPEGGFPFSIIAVCVSFYLLWREILDRCVLMMYIVSAFLKGKKIWMRLFSFPDLCLRAVTVQISFFLRS